MLDIRKLHIYVATSVFHYVQFPILCCNDAVPMLWLNLAPKTSLLCVKHHVLAVRIMGGGLWPDSHLVEV